MRRCALHLTTAITVLVSASTAQAAYQKHSVSARPSFDLVAANPSQAALFEYPSGATRLSNGTIVVNDYYAARLLYFDSVGKLIRKVGGHGQGPGEFGGALVWKGQCVRDSVFVTIPDRMQVAVLDAAGSIRRTFSPPADLAAAPCLPNSRSARWHNHMTRMPRAGDPPLRAQLHVTDLEGDSSVSIGEFVLGEYGPLRPLTRALVRDDRVYIGSGHGDSLDVYSVTGEKLKTLRLRLPETEIDVAHYEAALDQFVSYLVLPEDRRQMKELFRDRFPKPARAPAYTSFYVDAHGLIWFTTSLPGEPTIIHVVTNDEGNAVGTFEFAQELRILEVGADYLLAAFHDATGRAHVGVYQISRP
jgi:hypothetical protein